MTGLVVMNEKNMKKDSHGLICCIPAGSWSEGMRTMNIMIANQYSTSCPQTKVIVNTTGSKNLLLQ